ncbi:MAG: hypothetical protein ACKO3W_01905 [bacterium]
MRWVGLAFGIACLLGAIVVSMREHDALSRALGALREARPGMVALLVAGFAAAIPLTSMLFAILLRRFARVGFGEMLALIAATSLANMLPLKPGFVGRVAWHRARHGVRAADTLRTVIEAILLSALVAALMLAAVPLLRAAGAPVALALLAPALFACVGVAPRARTFAAALLVRQCEFALSVGRYAIALELVGAATSIASRSGASTEIHSVASVGTSIETAIVLACASAVATLVPFVSNGLGLREWTTALILPALDAGTFAAGVSAELVLRAAELLVTVPAGLIGGAWLARHARSVSSTQRAP